MKGNIRALGINLLLCVASISIFFGGVELLARLKYTPQKIEYIGVFEYDRENAFRLRSNFEGEYNDVTFSTNSLGLRGAEISVEKPENTKRVLVLGDSVMFGHQVLGDETASYFLEQELNKHFAELEENISVQVINAAVPGNSAYQEYHDLMRGLELGPDVIVLQFSLNDVMDHWASWMFEDMGLDNSEKRNQDYLFGRSNMPYADHLLKQHSAFYLFLKDMYGRVRFQDVTGDNIVEKAGKEEFAWANKIVNEPEHPKVLEGWENCLKWMREMTNLASKKDIPFILMASPLEFQLSREKKFAHPQRILQTFAVEEGIYFVDLLDILRGMYAESAVGEPVETAEEIDKIIVETREEVERITIATGTGAFNPFEDFWYEYFVEYVHPSLRGNELIADTLKPVVLNKLQ